MPAASIVDCVSLPGRGAHDREEGEEEEEGGNGGGRGGTRSRFPNQFYGFSYVTYDGLVVFDLLVSSM